MHYVLGLFHGPTFVVLPVRLLVERRGRGLVQVVEQRDALVRVDGDEHVRAHRVDMVALEPPAHTHTERDEPLLSLPLPSRCAFPWLSPEDARASVMWEVSVKLWCAYLWSTCRRGASCMLFR